MQRDAQTIDFEFGNIFEFAAVGKPFTSIRERAKLVNVVRIIERHERNRVSKRPKTLGFSTDALLRAVGSDQLRVIAFKPLQSFEKLVELKIRNLWRRLL